MNHRTSYSAFLRLLMFLIILVLPVFLSAQTGVVQGRVTDVNSGDPLPGANVQIEGTMIGSATDIEGRYRILNAPLGRQQLRFSYMGYQTKTEEVTVRLGETVIKDVSLAPIVLKGREVVVTAQAEGQLAAINQQLRSEQIVNVVSSDRIRELPDQNAAESVGRLPGIAIERNAGEGQKVLIRGLAPKYSAITINGQKIPATDATDRSVDLSMISSDILAGIEVYKQLTPDQDADVAGGQVNFVIRRAEEGFHSRLDMQTGYNGLTEAFGQFKVSGTVSNSFFNNRLGVIATGSMERTPYPADELNKRYGMEQINVETGDVLLVLNYFTVNHSLSDRRRLSASLLFDYDLGPGHLIRLSSFISSRSNENTNYNQEYDLNQGRIHYRINESTSENALWNNALGGSHTLFNRLELDWGASYSAITNENPNNYGIGFTENSAFNPGWNELLPIEKILPFAKYNLAKTEMSDNPSVSSSRTKGWDWSTQLNIKLPFSFTNKITGYLKTGFKHRTMTRERRRERHAGHDMNDKLIVENPGKYELSRAALTINNFLDPDFDADDFLGGRYGSLFGINTGVAKWLFETYPEQYNYNREAILDDYDASEAVTAGYIMGSLNIGRLMILPGVRYESTHNDYTGKFTDDIRGQWGQFGHITDTSAVKTYDDWLPMVHVRYDIFRNLALRLAVTRTLIRPDYENLVPTAIINVGDYTIRRGNPDLRHTKAWNYDVLLSLYSSRLGLFTVGGFYKQLEDIDFFREIMLLDPTADYYGYQLNTPVNAEGVTDVYGFEVELQTNLRFLPGPLDGIVLNANYTRTYGNTFFPSNRREYGPPPYYYTIYVLTERKAPIPGQSDHIANVSIGFEKWGFSGRVSMVYQSDILKDVGIIALNDQWQNGFVRWDATASQKLYKGLTLYWNVNNFANMAEKTYKARDVEVKNLQRAYTGQSYYEWSTTAGLRYTF
jgi:TonB-dependent receptor